MANASGETSCWHPGEEEADKDGDADGGEQETQNGTLHPVWHQLALKNGEINRMEKEEIKNKLHQLGLNTKGSKDVIKKRLKQYYKTKKLMQAHVRPPRVQSFDMLVVIDFEATCQECNKERYMHEIIEFPAILVDAKLRKVVDEFHYYVRPKVNKTLTDFCTSLTGITQNQVDGSEEFPAVLVKFESWLESHRLGTNRKFAVVTDGPWDMSRFLYLQCKISKLNFPRWGRKWINLCKCYSNFFKLRRPKLSTMLEGLGMTFEGKPHSGIDDARNISRVLIRLLEDGCHLKVNELLHSQKIATFARLQGEELDSREEQSANTVDTMAAEKQLNQKMKTLSVTTKEEKIEHYPEDDGYDDLLAYYNLQHS